MVCLKIGSFIGITLPNNHLNWQLVTNLRNRGEKLADVNKGGFDKRLQKIEEKTLPNRRVERRVGKDGLVVEVVKKKRKALLPYRAILTAALMTIALKGYLLAELGPEQYVGQIERMRSGHAGEIMAAFLLDTDPATKFVAGLLETYIR